MIQTQASMKNLYIGVMSGTSVDAIDIVAVEIFDDSFNFFDAKSFKFETTLRKEILELSRNSLELNNSEFKLIDKRLANTYGEAINEFISQLKINKNNIAAVGLHGQTILHKPDSDNPFSLQIGDGQTVSDITGLTIIDDFRSADIRAGGQGAPLAPLFHSWLFRIPNKNRALVNIGGISNISILDDNPLRGHDLGPGNILLDSWAQTHERGRYDGEGLWGREGNTNENLLDIFLEDNFLRMAPPKSSGADYFNLDWIKTNLNIFDQNIEPQDVQSTLTELTAKIISDYLNKLSNIREAAICGGGTKNEYLAERIMKLYKGKLFKSDNWGLMSEWVEASGFAYLAYLRLKNQDLDLSNITGSTKKVRLGEIHTP